MLAMHKKRPMALDVLLLYAPLFKGLAAESLARIARYTTESHLAKQETLFEAGSPCDGFHLVIHGQLKLFNRPANSNESVLEILQSGQTFGETLMFSEHPYMVSAQALTNTWVLHIPKRVILEELETNTDLRLKLLTQMSSHLHDVMNCRRCETQQSGTQRFIGYLLRQLPDPAHPGLDVIVQLPTTKSNISSILNLTKEHFSRILRALSSRGLIAVSGCHILIPDVARLIDYQDGAVMA